VKRVILVHGIREYGEWYREIGPHLEAKELTVHEIQYKYATIFNLLIPWLGRQERYAEVKDKLESAFREWPDDEISVIAFSFGTYLVTRAILANPEVIHPAHLILSGAIASRDLPWAKLCDAVGSGEVLNECGVEDPWPIVAEAFSVGYGFVGTRGVGHPRVKDRYHLAKHSTIYDVQGQPIAKEWARIIACNARPTSSSRARSPRWFGFIRTGIRSALGVAVAALALALFHEPIEDALRRPLLWPGQVVTVAIDKTIQYENAECVDGARSMTITTTDRLQFSNYTERYFARWTGTGRRPPPTVMSSGVEIEPSADRCQLNETCDQAWIYEAPVNGRRAEITWVRSDLPTPFARTRVGSRSHPLRQLTFTLLPPSGAETELSAEATLIDSTGQNTRTVERCAKRGNELTCGFGDMPEGALAPDNGLIIRHDIELPSCEAATPSP
jgi:hypothetical protein